VPTFSSSRFQAYLLFSSGDEENPKGYEKIRKVETFNVMPRRIPDFPDSFHSWNFLSSIGSGITFLSFAIFSY